MNGNSEFGKCAICGIDADLQRTTFEYNVKCQCHSPNHFIMIAHCSKCIPVEPKETEIRLKTEELPKKQNEEHLDFFQMN